LNWAKANPWKVFSKGRYGAGRLDQAEAIIAIQKSGGIADEMEQDAERSG